MQNREKDWYFFAPVVSILTFILFQLLFYQNHGTLELGEITPTDKLDIQQGNNVFRLLIMSVAMVFSFIGIIIQVRMQRFRTVNLWLMAPFVVYCFISIAWSPVPFISLKRCVQILGLLAIGIYAVQALNHSERILRIVRNLLAVVIIINLFVILVVPAIGITPGTGEWRGFLQHKNSLGAITILTIAVWLPALFERQSWRKKILTVGLVATTLLLTVKSDSQTAVLINLILLAVCFFIIFPLPWSMKISLSAAAVLFLIFGIMNFNDVNFSSVTGSLFERSATLTGRTQLWRLVFNEFLTHPYFGIGYNGFWTSQIIDSDWVTFQAHNGYLDILNELGLVGAFLFFSTLIGLMYRLFRLMKNAPLQYLPYFLLLAGISMHNIMESNFCRAMTRNWFLYLLIYVVVFATSLPKSGRSIQEKHP
ncbi:MAG: O-antigen ligase family protein [Calditrichaeota bacterium]|nr:MAG: O-antigen ligase family protein [Calditrichota bacterium]